MFQQIQEQQRLKSSADARDTIGAILRDILQMEDKHDQDKEHFWVIGLNTKNVILFVDLVTLGILDQTVVHPREVFRVAVGRGGCKSVILAHNHPSGDPEPSEKDISLTKRMEEAGDMLGVQVLDHIVVGNNTWATTSVQEWRADH